MKKTNNKGFSLVELIIVIAIMAILAGAIAPALIKYIDKSRKSNDVSSAKTIKTAVETALGTESVYETLTASTSVTKITILPNQPTAAADGTKGTDAIYVQLNGATEAACVAGGGASIEECAKAIGSNIGEKTPKTKYKKNIDKNGEKKTDGFKPEAFVAFITPGGTVYVCVAKAEGAGATCNPNGSGSGVASFADCAPLAPEVCKGYQ